MAYLWDVILVRITIKTACGELISARVPYLARQLSVRKVVPTLTSRCAKIDLLMAGAKQRWDTRFILVLAEGRTSSRGALVALYCKAPWCSERGATSKEGEEEKPPSPCELIEANANILGEGGRASGCPVRHPPRLGGRLLLL
jgi:hypothetical protein